MQESKSKKEGGREGGRGRGGGGERERELEYVSDRVEKRVSRR